MTTIDRDWYPVSNDRLYKRGRLARISAAVLDHLNGLRFSLLMSS